MIRSGERKGVQSGQENSHVRPVRSRPGTRASGVGMTGKNESPMKARALIPGSDVGIRGCIVGTNKPGLWWGITISAERVQCIGPLNLT